MLIAMAGSQKESDHKDREAASDLVQVAKQAGNEGLEDSTKAGLGHIAGYLARSATKGSQCSACTDLLIDREAAP